MIDTPERLASTVVSALQLEPPPSEEQIDVCIAGMAKVFGLNSDLTEEARKLIHARFRIRMDKGETLSKSDHEPWLAARRAEIDPFYWERYRELLLRGGWSPLVLAQLDRTTDDLVDLLGNPADANAFDRRGLVVGDVQSGKTATYAAAICKASDAGYRIIILLTGILENVRRQTQERLDASVVGFDSREFLDKASLKHKRLVGVGLIDGKRDGVVFTSVDNDFRKASANSVGLSLNALNEPVPGGDEEEHARFGSSGQLAPHEECGPAGADRPADAADRR